jgi:EAL domain-containing protein (putative c-di-GMP-specific phosphodiesterase class I)
MSQGRDDSAQQHYLESLVGQLTGWNNPRQRLAQAFSQNEFILYQQAIQPLVPQPGRQFVEILVRHEDEEKHLTPPGAFLPMLEYYDMMPQLDRWVTRRVLEWHRDHGVGRTLRYSINCAAQTMCDAGFAAFVQEQAFAVNCPPSVLCFELPESELLTHLEAVRQCADALKALGCRIAIGSVGRQSVSFKAVHSAGANYVKLDGAIVRELHRDPVAQAKAQAISRVCRSAQIRTIAEFVEEAETLERLRAIGVDYAQGFGISRPGPLADLAAPSGRVA